MATLSTSQVKHFNQDGYLFLANAIPTDKLHKMQNEFEQWKEESRNFSEPYGKTFDNRPRFDIEPGHSADKPALRRIASPIEISETYLNFMRNNRALDALIDILDPNLKFENAKINSKQPGAATQIKYHQDFLFEPHTNDDMITVLFLSTTSRKKMARWKLYPVRIKVHCTNTGTMAYSRVQYLTQLPLK
jgi:hypothetical protein